MHAKSPSAAAPQSWREVGEWNSDGRAKEERDKNQLIIDHLKPEQRADHGQSIPLRGNDAARAVAGELIH